MNCDYVQSLLLAYLDGEITPSERALILAHISSCSVCQQELDLLSTARSHVRSALQRRAIQAVPSQEAWNRLEARLTEAAQPSSNARRTAWLTRKAPNANRVSNQFFGGVTMQKRWIFSGLMGAVVLSILAILVAQTATPVSARQILDRAYEAQSAQNEGEGIHHMRVETYQNLCARPEGQAASVATVMESYLDLQTGFFRNVVTEANTGNVLDVFAYDGAYIYSGHRSIEVKSEQPEQGTEPRPRHVVCDQPLGNTDSSLTVYRGAQNSIAGVNLPRNEGVQTHEEIFQKMRNDPDAELLGEETWIDGRNVYVLRSWQPVKVVTEESTEIPMGWVVSYFDMETYKIVESRATIEKDGQELLVYSYRVLVDEILPVGSDQDWAPSDLAGIMIVDDPDGQYVELLPEVISEEELARTPFAYLLNSIPEGFTLEISALPKKSADQPFFYIASYRNESGDYFIIQSIGSKEIKLIEEGSSESYTTTSGLILTIMDDTKDPSGKAFTSAILETPEGASFILSSTFIPEQLKTWSENVVLVSR
jgi:anti-sigma factor RsiW